jgi:hypothetical protein
MDNDERWGRIAARYLLFAGLIRQARRDQVLASPQGEAVIACEFELSSGGRYFSYAISVCLDGRSVRVRICSWPTVPLRAYLHDKHCIALHDFEEIPSRIAIFGDGIDRARWRR